MPIYTYVRNQDPKSKVTGIEVEGGLTLYIGTYANLSNRQLEQIYSSGVGVVLVEGIVPPATNAGTSVTSNATIIPPFEPSTIYKEFQAVTHEEKIFSAKKEFESGSGFVESNWYLISGSGSSGVGKATVWAPKTTYVENQLVVSPEGEILRTLREFKSGETYVF